MLRLAFLLSLLLPLAAHAQQAPAPVAGPAAPARTFEEDPLPEGYYVLARLQGLNKVTARISELEAPVGSAIRFGNLEIIVKRCWAAPATERPESAALMEIIDRKPGEAPELAFNGWMFSSSPSLAGLEHPVYDVIVLACERRKIGEAEGTQPAEAAAAEAKAEE